MTDVPRGEVAFRHLGIADALSRTQGIDPDIDAYFNWPGFFALLATVLGATGLDPVAVALWAPVLNVGLWLVALGVLTGYLTRDPRRRWLVLWVFCLGSWQDQDYLSPQAFGFFLYLVVVALLLGPLAARAPVFRGFRRADLVAWWRGRLPAESRPGHRVSALAVILLLVAVICASHQLTPFMVLIAMTALTLSGRVWPSRLPLITVVVLTLWLVYPASAYLVGHPPLADAGLQGATEANVVDRLSGTAGHVLVVQVRMVLTVVLWALAAAGACVTGAGVVSISGWSSWPSRRCCSSPRSCTAGRCSSVSRCSRCLSSRCWRARSCFPRTAAPAAPSRAAPRGTRPSPGGERLRPLLAAAVTT